MSAITKSELNRSLGNHYLEVNKTSSNQHELIEYVGAIYYAGRFYRVSVLVPNYYRPPSKQTIAKLLQTPGVHVQVEVYAMFAVARFTTVESPNIH